MSEIVFIEGPGAGSIQQLTMPPKGSVRRDLLDAQLATGEMKIVDAADVEEATVHQVGPDGVRRWPVRRWVRKGAPRPERPAHEHEHGPRRDVSTAAARQRLRGE